MIVSIALKRVARICTVIFLFILAIGIFTPVSANTFIITEFTTPSAVLGDIILGPDGNIWFTELNDKIGRITSDGVVTEFSTGITAGSQPYSITAGPDGNIWFTERFGNKIGRITPDGVITEFSTGITPYYTQLNGITAGPDGNIWFTEVNGKIGRISPDGVVTKFSSLTSAFGNITAGPDGNLWFIPGTNEEGSWIGRITPDGDFTWFSTGIRTYTVLGDITAGPDGNIWFTELAGNKVCRITPDGVVTEFSTGITPNSWPYRITAGPDGNIWFTERIGKIGRITPNGVVTEFLTGDTTDLWFSDITAGPDGNIWFTDTLHLKNKIGRVVLCDGTLSDDLKIYLPIVAFDGAYFWGTAQCEVAVDSGVMCRVTSHAANPADFAGCQPSTLSSDMKHLHIPSGVYKNVSYHADFENVPTTDGQIWFELTTFGQN